LPGFARGGRLARLEQAELRDTPIRLLALLVQLIVVFLIMPNPDVPLAADWAQIAR
jgi:hypothetical protein